MLKIKYINLTWLIISRPDKIIDLLNGFCSLLNEIVVSLQNPKVIIEKLGTAKKKVA